MPNTSRTRIAGPATALLAALAVTLPVPSTLAAGNDLDAIRAEIVRRHDEGVRRL